MKSIILPVPHFDQNNNDTNFFGEGWRQCCMTANAMAAEYLLSKNGLETLFQRAKRLKLREPESAYGQILNKYGDTTNHTANGRALAELKLESYFSASLTIDHAIASLNAGIPMPVGFIYKTSGHIACLIGVNLEEGYFTVNDPYGKRAGANNWYDFIGNNSGKNDRYSFSLMKEIWANPSDGWGRVFTRVNGKPTGL